jgi:hypothetical protein
MFLNCLTRPGTQTEYYDQNKKKQTSTKVWTKISETKISQTERRNAGTTEPNKNDPHPPNQQQQNNTQSGDTIIQWNIIGLKANFEELKMLATDIEPVAICLQETNQKPGQDII